MLFELYTRLVLVGMMLGTFFLPWSPSDPMGSTFVLSLWFLCEALPYTFHLTDITITDRILWLTDVLYSLAIPILLFFNVWLLIHSSKIVKRLYRVVLPILLFSTWATSMGIDAEMRGVGFWATIALVCIVLFFEIIFLTNEYHRRSKNRVVTASTKFT